jgi:cell division protein FtsB
VDSTNAERQRRYIARLKAAAVSNEEVATLKAKCVALEQQIIALRTQPGASAEIAALTAKCAKLEQEAVKLRAQVERLTTELFEATAKSRGRRSRPSPSSMPDELYRSLVKALHPDSRKHLSEAKLSELCALLNAWKDDGKSRKR